MNDLIFVEQHPMAGRVVPVENGITIGREGCDIVLADPEVSRRHAVVRGLSGRYSIEDLGSTNGTFVNEIQVDGSAELRQGDKLRFGQTVWRIEAPSAVTRVASAKGGS